MKIPVTILMIVTCIIATVFSVINGEVFHSIELASLAVLLTASLETLVKK